MIEVVQFGGRSDLPRNSSTKIYQKEELEKAQARLWTNIPSLSFRSCRVSIGGALQDFELARPPVDINWCHIGGVSPTEGDFLFSARGAVFQCVLVGRDIECSVVGAMDGPESRLSCGGTREAGNAAP